MSDTTETPVVPDDVRAVMRDPLHRAALDGRYAELLSGRRRSHVDTSSFMLAMALLYEKEKAERSATRIRSLGETTTVGSVNGEALADRRLAEKLLLAISHVNWCIGHSQALNEKRVEERLQEASDLAHTVFGVLAERAGRREAAGRDAGPFLAPTGEDAVTSDDVPKAEVGQDVRYLDSHGIEQVGSVLLVTKMRGSDGKSQAFVYTVTHPTTASRRIHLEEDRLL